MEHKADVHLKNEIDQRSASNLLCLNEGPRQIIKMLMARGASIEEEDNKGYTPTMCAAQCGRAALLDYFKKLKGPIFITRFTSSTLCCTGQPAKNMQLPQRGSWMKELTFTWKTAKGGLRSTGPKEGNQNILELLVEFICEEGYTNLLDETHNEGETPFDLSQCYESYRATKCL